MVMPQVSKCLTSHILNTLIGSVEIWQYHNSKQLNDEIWRRWNALKRFINVNCMHHASMRFYQIGMLITPPYQLLVSHPVNKWTHVHDRCDKVVLIFPKYRYHHVRGEFNLRVSFDRYVTNNLSTKPELILLFLKPIKSYQCWSFRKRQFAWWRGVLTLFWPNSVWLRKFSSGLPSASFVIWSPAGVDNVSLSILQWHRLADWTHFFSNCDLRISSPAINISQDSEWIRKRCTDTSNIFVIMNRFQFKYG